MVYYHIVMSLAPDLKNRELKSAWLGDPINLRAIPPSRVKFLGSTLNYGFTLRCRESCGLADKLVHRLYLSLKPRIIPFEINLASFSDLTFPTNYFANIKI